MTGCAFSSAGTTSRQSASIVPREPSSAEKPVSTKLTGSAANCSLKISGGQCEGRSLFKGKHTINRGMRFFPAHPFPFPPSSLFFPRREKERGREEGNEHEGLTGSSLSHHLPRTQKISEERREGRGKNPLLFSFVRFQQSGSSVHAAECPFSPSAAKMISPVADG